MLILLLVQDYAVVVSRETRDAWPEVVEALRKKHDAEVIVHDGEWREPLAKLMPRYACFVARPEEAGREFVIAAHRGTRALDEDPYPDVIWGILTGYEKADALRIAEHATPLEVRRAAAGCGVDLGAFESGVWYSESTKNLMWEKPKDGEAAKREAPDDTTAALVAALDGADFFTTSGHATHRDWQIGYSYKNGQFRCRDGRLFGLDTAGKRHDIDTPNPKIYSAAGNCLAGLIEDRETMALAWMRAGGAYQMAGYVVSTWHGYGGWGVNKIFIGQQTTFAEAFHLNSIALIHQLESRFGDKARVNFERWEIERNPSLPNELAKEHGIADRDCLGLLWDRDTVAFYGDPAWEARIVPQREPGWKQTLTENDGIFTFEASGTGERPPMALLPRRLVNPAVLEGEGVVTDTFVLLPGAGKITFR